MRMPEGRLMTSQTAPQVSPGIVRQPQQRALLPFAPDVRVIQQLEKKINPDGDRPGGSE